MYNNVPPFMIPNGMNMTNDNYNQDIRNLENRVYNLEKEVNRLKRKVEKLENAPTPYHDNYTSNYQPNTYNMM